MKRAIKAYIDENYEGQEMPQLSKQEVGEWYDLVQLDQELPLGESGTSTLVCRWISQLSSTNRTVRPGPYLKRVERRRK